jgi:hypothetical protein
MRKGFLVSGSSPKTPAAGSSAAAPMGSDSPDVLRALQFMLECGEFADSDAGRALEAMARTRLAAAPAPPPPLPADMRPPPNEGIAVGDHNYSREAQTARALAAQKLISSVFGSAVTLTDAAAAPPQPSSAHQPHRHGPGNDHSLDSLSVRNGHLLSEVCFGCPCAECVPPMLNATRDYGEVSPIGRVSRAPLANESIWCVRPPERAGGPIILERRRNEKHEVEDTIETPYSRRVEDAIKTISSGGRGPAVAGAQAIIQAHITDAIDERERKRAEEKAQRPAAAKGKASASSASSTPSRAAKRFVARDDPALAVYGGFEGGESVYGTFKGEDVLHAPVGHRPPAGQPYCARHVLALHAMQSEELEAMSQEMAETMRIGKKAGPDPLNHARVKALRVDDPGFPAGSKDYWIIVVDPHDSFDDLGGWRTLAFNESKGKWVLHSTAEPPVEITVDAAFQRALDTFAANVECVDEILAMRTICDRLALAVLSARIPPRKNKELQWHAPDFASASPLGEMHFQLTAHTYDTAAVIATRMDTGVSTVHYHSIAQINDFRRTKYRIGQSATLRSQYNERLLAALGPPIADGAVCGCKRCRLEAKKDEESNKTTPAAASAGKSTAKPETKPDAPSTASAWVTAARVKLDAMPKEQKSAHTKALIEQYALDDNISLESRKLLEGDGLPGLPTSLSDMDDLKKSAAARGILAAIAAARAAERKHEAPDAAAPGKSAAEKREPPDAAASAASAASATRSLPDLSTWATAMHEELDKLPEGDRLAAYREFMFTSEPRPGMAESMNYLARKQKLGLPELYPGKEYEHDSPLGESGVTPTEKDVVASLLALGAMADHPPKSDRASAWAAGAHSFLAGLPAKDRDAAYRAKIESLMPDTQARECFHLLTQKLGMGLPDLFPGKVFEEGAVDAALAASPWGSDAAMREHLKNNPPADLSTLAQPGSSNKDAAAASSAPAAKPRRRLKKGKAPAGKAAPSAKQRAAAAIPAFSARFVSNTDGVPAKYKLWVEEMRAELDFLREDDRLAYFQQRAHAKFPDPAEAARFNNASMKGGWGLPDLFGDPDEILDSCSDEGNESSGSDGLYYGTGRAPAPKHSSSGAAKTKVRCTPQRAVTLADAHVLQTPAPAPKLEARTESSASAKSKAKMSERKQFGDKLAISGDFDAAEFLKVIGLVPPTRTPETQSDSSGTSTAPRSNEPKRKAAALSETEVKSAEPAPDAGRKLPEPQKEQTAKIVVCIPEDKSGDVDGDADSDAPDPLLAAIEAGEYDGALMAALTFPGAAARPAAGPAHPELNVERDAAVVAAAFASESPEAQMAYYSTPAHELGEAIVPLKPGVAGNFTSYFKAAQASFAAKFGKKPSAPAPKAAPSSPSDDTPSSPTASAQGSTAADSQSAASGTVAHAEGTASPPSTQPPAGGTTEPAENTAAPASPASQPAAAASTTEQAAPSTPPRTAHLKQQYESWASGAASFTSASPAAMSPAATFSPVSAVTASAASSAQKSDATAFTSPPTSPSPALVCKRSSAMMRQTDAGPLPVRGMPRAFRPLRAPHAEATSKLEGQSAPSETQDKATAGAASSSTSSAAASAVPAASSKAATEAELRAEMADLAERMARLMPGPKAHNLERLTNPNLPDRGQPFSSRRF